MSSAATPQNAQEGARRILKNVGWLLGGKGFGAVCSLVYLAILARSLGVKDFGHFSLIFGTGLAIVELAGFQTWQMVVRYGTPHVGRKEWAAFGRLAMGGGLIDFAGALFGCLVAYIAIIYFGPSLELNPQYSHTAFAFVCALVFARVSAPLGVLRTLDRYDVAVKAGAITPISRLIAALFIWWSGATVEKFLFAWAAIELFSAVLYWFLARRIAPQAVRLSNLFTAGRIREEHPGIFRFLWITYASTSLWGALQQGPLLAVGYFLGTSAAGVYRIADQLAKGLGKLATLSAQALYPEVNRQRHASPFDQFSKLLKRINITVIVAGAIVVALAVAIGGHILELIGGEEFRRGGPVLIPLVLAASLELASVSYEPVLHALGKAHYQLYSRLFTLLAMAGFIILLVSGGPVWVGWAVAFGMIAGYLGTSLVVWLTIRRSARTESEGP